MCWFLAVKHVCYDLSYSLTNFCSWLHIVSRNVDGNPQHARMRGGYRKPQLTSDYRYTRVCWSVVIPTIRIDGMNNKQKKGKKEIYNSWDSCLVTHDGTNKPEC